jgi:hypothetical protein
MLGRALIVILVSAAPSHVSQRAAVPAAEALAARAGIRGTVVSSCRGEFGAGHAGGFAVAVNDREGGGRYLIIDDGAQVRELAAYAGTADLSCYTVRDADGLNATIARSDTMNGRVTAEWDGTVACGFIEPTIAVCWQYAPEQERYVRVGGWTT